MAVNWNLFQPSTGVSGVSRNPAVAQAILPQRRSGMQRVGDFIDSPTGKLATSALGTFLDARDNQSNRDAELADSAADRASRERIATMGQLGDLQSAEMTDARSRAAGVLDANPLGAEHDFAAKEAFLRNAAGMFGNTSISPSDPAVAAAMGKVSGGFQITPDFIRAMQDTHSQDRVNGAIAQRRMDTSRLDPGRGLATQLGDATLDGRVNDFAAQQKAEMDQQAQMRREAITRALDNNPTGEQGMSPEEEFNANFEAIARAKQQTGDWEKAYQMVTGKPWPKGQHITINGNQGTMVKDRGILKTIGKIGAIAAPIVAAPFTGGASLAAIGALSGAASGALNGGGLKGALTGGAMGAFTGGMGGAANSAAQVGAKAALQRAVLNPQAMTRMASALPGRAGQVAGVANTALSFRR